MKSFTYLTASHCGMKTVACKLVSSSLDWSLPLGYGPQLGLGSPFLRCIWRPSEPVLARSMAHVCTWLGSFSMPGHISWSTNFNQQNEHLSGTLAFSYDKGPVIKAWFTIWVRPTIQTVRYYYCSDKMWDKCTLCSRHWDPPSFRTSPDREEGSIACKRKNTRATSKSRHWRTNLRPRVIRRRPEETIDKFLAWNLTSFQLLHSSLTFIPSSQEIQRWPLVKKQATECLAKWWIHPSFRSWVMTASIHGNPVPPFAHFASASGLRSQGIWTQIGFPYILSKLGFFVEAV